MRTDELEIWKRLNECECVRPDYWLPLNGDRYIWIDADGNPRVKNYYIGKEEINGSCIWIPPLYDPIRPERSLIGIAKGTVQLRMNPFLFGKWVCDIYNEDGVRSSQTVSDRPDLALAKAIIEQSKEKQK